MRLMVCVIVLFSALFAACGGAGGSGGLEPTPFVPDFAERDVPVSGPAAIRAGQHQIASAGDRIYAVWQDERHFAAQNMSIYFNFSEDGGRTWQPDDIRLDSADPGGASQPAIACDGLNVYVVWVDRRGGLADLVQINRSQDGGKTWLPDPIRVDHRATGTFPSTPQVAARGADVYVVWVDDRNGELDIFFNRSADGGASWEAADTRLDTSPLSSTQPRIDMEGEHLVVIWKNLALPDHAEIHVNRSLDGGASWLDGDRRLTASKYTTTSNHKVALSGGRVYVIWSDNFGRRVRLNRSDDGGATWQPNDPAIDTTDAPINVAGLVAEGDRVHVLWEDRRNLEWDIIHRSSNDAGASWGPETNVVGLGAEGLSDSQRARLASHGENVYVVWSDDRNGARDILFNHSLDGGATWQHSPLRLDTSEAGTSASDGPRLLVDGFDVHVAWLDERLGDSDLFFNGSTRD